MEHRDKILEYYRSGRYECDYHFHLELKNALEELNLYRWIPVVQSQLSTLKKITELTQINAKSLDQDYDDEEGVCQTFKIRQLINQLNTKDIACIISECEALNWESYSAKLCKQLSGKKDYESIVQRIHTTIHSQEFRIDSMLFTGFFQLMNSKGLTQLLQAYTTTIEYFLTFLNEQRKNFHTLIEAEEYSNLARIPKVQHYVGTLYLSVRTCLRFCQIVKILTGKNNLSLKFTVVKKELDKLMKPYSEWKFQLQKEDLFSVLPIYKQHLQTGKAIHKQKICKYCFKTLSTELHCHSFCYTLIHKREMFIK